MIRTVAIENYRSIKRLAFELGQISVVTGANGVGKSNVHKALRLLAATASGDALRSLALEGGMQSALHAGKREKGPLGMRLGFGSDDWSYAIEFGLPNAADPGNPFRLDPGIAAEAIWHGPVLRPATTVLSRRGHAVSSDSTGRLELEPVQVPAYESVLTHADPAARPELHSIADSLRRWRFYDQFRTDASAPVRRPGFATFTPVLDHAGEDLAAALLTVLQIGHADVLHGIVDSAFPGARLRVHQRDDGAAVLTLQESPELREFGVHELSDGTLRFLMLCAALLSPRPPEFLVLNEPEASLHRSLLPTLGALIAEAAQDTQILVVTHAAELVRTLSAEAQILELERGLGTQISGQGILDEPAWHWPKR